MNTSVIGGCAENYEFKAVLNGRVEYSTSLTVAFESRGIVGMDDSMVISEVDWLRLGNYRRVL
jgi:hypothetical protein